MNPRDVATRENMVGTPRKFSRMTKNFISTDPLHQHGNMMYVPKTGLHQQIGAERRQIEQSQPNRAIDHMTKYPHKP